MFLPWRTKQIDAADLVKQIKAAIQQAQGSLIEGNLTISAVDLEIKAILMVSGEAGLKFKVVPVELGGSYSRSAVRTIRLSLVPDAPSVELLAPVSDQLRDAIEVISQTVREAAESKPRFALREANVELDIGVTKEGKIKVFVGTAGQERTAHHIMLTLAPTTA